MDVAPASSLISFGSLCFSCLTHKTNKQILYKELMKSHSELWLCDSIMWLKIYIYIYIVRCLILQRAMYILCLPPLYKSFIYLLIHIFILEALIWDLLCFRSYTTVHRYQDYLDTTSSLKALRVYKKISYFIRFHLKGLTVES